jgi:hypothetical protein
MLQGVVRPLRLLLCCCCCCCCCCVSAPAAACGCCGCGGGGAICLPLALAAARHASIWHGRHKALLLMCITASVGALVSTAVAGLHKVRPGARLWTRCRAGLQAGCSCWMLLLLQQQQLLHGLRVQLSLRVLCGAPQLVQLLHHQPNVLAGRADGKHGAERLPRVAQRARKLLALLVQLGLIHMAERALQRHKRLRHVGVARGAWCGRRCVRQLRVWGGPWAISAWLLV